VYSAATGMVESEHPDPANSGWVLTDASAINDAGQIAGIGYAPNGGDCNVIACNYQHAYLLTP